MALQLPSYMGVNDESLKGPPEILQGSTVDVL